MSQQTDTFEQENATVYSGFLNILISVTIFIFALAMIVTFVIAAAANFQRGIRDRYNTFMHCYSAAVLLLGAALLLLKHKYLLYMILLFVLTHI